MKVDSATSDISNQIRWFGHQLHSKPTVVFDVLACLGSLTEKMTSETVNSSGPVN